MLYNLQQGGLRNGLVEISVHSRRKTHLFVTGLSIGCQGNNLCSAAIAFDPSQLSGGFVTIHFGHLAIHQHQIKALFPHLRESFSPIFRLLNLTPNRLQLTLQDNAVGAAIVHYQDGSELSGVQW